MDLYLLGLLLGATGLGAMAITGLGRHGAGGGRGGSHTGSGHAGSGHPLVHGHSPGSTHAAGLTHSAGALRAGAKAGHQVGHAMGWRPILAIASPRFLFSASLGFGAVGLALEPLLGGIPILGRPLILAAALVGGVAFERFIVTPIWNASLKFASSPALTLESCISEEATAITAFDANGQGIVAIDLDGQVVQVLGTLQSADREMGIKIRAGERVRIEAIDEARNRCTVSLV